MRDEAQNPPKTKWARHSWGLLAILFALIGLAQIFRGKASGRYGFGVYRETEPVLFWIYIGSHFLVAGCLLIVAYGGRRPSDEKSLTSR